MLPESIAHNFFNFIIKAMPLDSKQIHKVKCKRLSENVDFIACFTFINKIHA